MVWTLGPSWRDLGPCVAWRETTIQWPTSHVLQIPSQCQYVHAQEKCITTHTLLLGSCRTYFYSSSHLLCWRLSTSFLFHFPSCPGFSLNLLSLEWLHIFLLRSLRELQSKRFTCIRTCQEFIEYCSIISQSFVLIFLALVASFLHISTEQTPLSTQAKED